VAARTAENLGAALQIFDLFMGAYSPGLSVRLHPHDPALVFFEHRVELEPAPSQAQTVELSLGIMLRVLQFMLGPDYRPISAHIRIHRWARPRLPALLRLPGPVRRTGGGAHHQGRRPGPPVASRSPDPSDRHGVPGQHRRSAPADHRPNGLRHHSTPAADRSRHHREHRHADGRASKGVAAQALRGADHLAQIVDQVRRDIAQHGLANPDITLAHLTRQLGYAEQSVLTRACQRWFGTTPTLYRAALLAASG
jgi:AraC-like DNA-binding protein